jgi:hypothetical protein
MIIPRWAVATAVVCVLSGGVQGSASAQWGISLDAQRSAYGGASKDTSQGPMGSLRPSKSQAITVRVDRRWKRFSASLGARAAQSSVVLDAEGVYVGVPDEFKLVEFLPEVSWRVVRTSRGATLDLYGGPVIGVWTFEDFGGRLVPGATAGLHAKFPIFDRVALSLRVGGSLMRSVFRDGELPPEVVLHPMRRSEIALGLRYGR